MNFRKWGFCLILLLGLAHSARGQNMESVPEPLKNVHRIVCLGDSITQIGEGTGGYVWMLRRYLTKLYPGTEVINAGISGHKSTDMLARFQHDVLDRKPDMVTISVGVNDVWHGFYDNHPTGDGPRGVKLEDYESNVEKMMSLAEQAGVKVVLFSTTVIHEDLKNRENAKLASYNVVLRMLARKHHALFIDFQKPFQTLIRTYQSTTGCRDNLLTNDGVHMNALGNRVMANVVMTGLGITPEAREKVRSEAEKS